MKTTLSAFLGLAMCFVVAGILFLTMMLGLRIMGVFPLVFPIKTYAPIGNHIITAYQAVEGQCDSEPDIGAGGRVANKGVPTGRWFASNTLPFGTKIVIPDISGNMVWTCRDRMNKRYCGCHIDLLVSKESVIFGKRMAKVFIVSPMKGE